MNYLEWLEIIYETMWIKLRNTETYQPLHSLMHIINNGLTNNPKNLAEFVRLQPLQQTSIDICAAAGTEL